MRRDWLAWLFFALSCAITVVVECGLTVLFLIAGTPGTVLFAPPSPGRAAEVPAAGSPKPPAATLGGAHGHHVLGRQDGHHRLAYLAAWERDQLRSPYPRIRLGSSSAGSPRPRGAEEEEMVYYLLEGQMSAASR